MAKHRIDPDDDGIDWPTTDEDEDKTEELSKWFSS